MNPRTNFIIWMMVCLSLMIGFPIWMAASSHQFHGEWGSDMQSARSLLMILGGLAGLNAVKWFALYQEVKENEC